MYLDITKTELATFQTKEVWFWCGALEETTGAGTILFSMVENLALQSILSCLTCKLL
jgi:hypothetical protein